MVSKILTGIQWLFGFMILGCAGVSDRLGTISSIKNALLFLALIFGVQVVKLICQFTYAYIVSEANKKARLGMTVHKTSRAYKI